MNVSIAHMFVVHLSWDSAKVSDVMCNIIDKLIIII